MKKWLFIALLALTVFNCKNKETANSSSDKALCECVELDEEGAWDGKLSQECIQIYLDKFGNDMEQMHNWFLENCPAYEFKKKKQKIEI